MVKYFRLLSRIFGFPYSPDTMERVRRLYVLWAPVIGYCGLIFYMSSLPGKSLSLSAFPGADKIVHIFEYSVLGFLLARSCIHTGNPVFPSTRRVASFAIALSILYGVSDEWHQSFVPYRTSDVLDLAADSAGGILGTLTYIYLNIRP